MSWTLSVLASVLRVRVRLMGCGGRLHDCYFAAMAGDAPAFEAWPNKGGMYYQPSPNSLPPPFILTLA